MVVFFTLLLCNGLAITSVLGKVGIQVGDSLLTDIQTTLFDGDASECATVLERYEKAASTTGMRCNWQKITIKNISTGRAPLRVQINDQLEEPVTKFTYTSAQCHVQ